MQVTYAYPLVPVANIIASVLSLIPLPWLLQHWNTGAWTQGLWVALLSLVTGIGTALWSDNVDIKAVVWCDIAVRIFHAGSLAVNTTNFVIARRIYLIVHIRSPLSQWQKTKAKLFDYFFCIGVPIISIGLSWFIQENRFTIIEGAGCLFAYYRSPLYWALYQVWFLIFAVLCAIYGVLIVYALARRQNALREVIEVEPDLSLTRLRRVLGLACAQWLITLPCAIHSSVVDIRHGVEPWKGLGDAHRDLSSIPTIPVSSLTKEDNTVIQWYNWITVAGSTVFFLLFGLSKAMWVDYWRKIVYLAGRIGITLPSKSTRIRSPRGQKNSALSIVFRIPATIASSSSQSRAIDELSRKGSGEVYLSDFSESSEVKRGQGDLEKCDLTTIGVILNQDKRDDSSVGSGSIAKPKDLVGDSASLSSTSSPL